MEWYESDGAEKVRSLEMDEIHEVFQSDRLPITTDDLIEEFGDCEIQYLRGSERLETILRTSGSETYETPAQIQLAILNGVGRDAVGRPRYSDRGDERHEELERKNQSF